MNPTLKSWIAVLALACTSVVTVATSKATDRQYPDSLLQANRVRDFYVASNCLGALGQDQITVANEVITNPSYLQFSDFGLPMTRLNFEANPQISGLVHGYQRTCTHSTEQIDSGAAILNIYTCHENGQPVCQVTFEPGPLSP